MSSYKFAHNGIDFKFRYSSKIDGGVMLNANPSKMKVNFKIFDSKGLFDDNRVLLLKKGDHVLLGLNLKDKKLQFLVTPESDRSKVREEDDFLFMAFDFQTVNTQDELKEFQEKYQTETK